MRRFFVVCFLVLMALPVWAADSNNQNTSAQTPPLLQQDTMKAMISIISRQVARRYDLRPEQAAVAQQMLEKNTLEFVNKHYNDLVVLVPQMQEMRMKVVAGQDPSPQQVKELAKKLQPIYKEATDLIVSENAKFHNILDDQQKAKHTKDMERMQQDAAQTQEKLTRWKNGEYTPGEFLSNRSKRAQTRVQKKPEKVNITSADSWEEFVKLFIDAFQLDQGQITMAYSMLNDMRAKAKAYRDDHSGEFAEVTAMLEKLKQVPATQPDQQQELKKWQTKLDQLNKPLLDMYNELGTRLNAIPTEAQRKAAQQALGGGQAPEAATTQSTQPAKK